MGKIESRDSAPKDKVRRHCRHHHALRVVACLWGWVAHQWGWHVCGEWHVSGGWHVSWGCECRGWCVSGGWHVSWGVSVQGVACQWGWHISGEWRIPGGGVLLSSLLVWWLAGAWGVVVSQRSRWSWNHWSSNSTCALKLVLFLFFLKKKTTFLLLDQSVKMCEGAGSLLRYRAGGFWSDMRSYWGYTLPHQQGHSRSSRVAEGAVSVCTDHDGWLKATHQNQQVRFVSVKAERPLPSRHNCHVILSRDRQGAQ